MLHFVTINHTNVLIFLILKLYCVRKQILCQYTMEKLFVEMEEKRERWEKTECFFIQFSP